MNKYDYDTDVAKKREIIQSTMGNVLDVNCYGGISIRTDSIEINGYELNKTNCKYGDKVLSSLLHKTVFVLSEDGGLPEILKVARLPRDNSISTFGTIDPSKLVEGAPVSFLEELQIYSNDTSSNDKYLSKQLPLDVSMYQKLKEQITLLQKIADNYELEIKRDPTKHEFLKPKPKETDEELIKRMEAKVDKIPYRYAKDIPLGSEFDEWREYVKAYNRIGNRRYRQKQKHVLNTILGKIPNLPTPEPEPVVTFAEPGIVTFAEAGFKLEIITEPEPEPERTDEEYLNYIYDKIQTTKDPSKLLEWREWERINSLYLRTESTPPPERTDDHYSILDKARTIYEITRHGIPESQLRGTHIPIIISV